MRYGIVSILWLVLLQFALPAITVAEPFYRLDARDRASSRPASSFDRSTGDSRPLSIGFYDPHDEFRNADELRIEHVFIYWQALDASMLAARMRSAVMKERTLLVTIEPYTKAANWRDGSEHLFSEIMQGKFDSQIAEVCGAIATYPGHYWIRWGHEMEEPSDRYPWAGGDAQGYAAAYRHFVDACRKIAPRARFVWSPKGERNLAEYYPGEAYVDLVGVSVWGLEEWDYQQHGAPRGFAETFGEKYRRIEEFNKPILIAELGISGQTAYRQKWIAEIFEVSTRRDEFPLLTGIVYFNDKEPHRWPSGFGSPDWRLAASELSAYRLD